MSDKERIGFRPLIYSGWHRVESLKRFIGVVAAAKTPMIDIDACEYCCHCKEPLALIETEKTDRPHPKKARVTQALARKAQIPGYSVAYSVDADDEIRDFRVQRIEPPDDWFDFMQPEEYADFLKRLRDDHVCPPAVAE